MMGGELAEEVINAAGLADVNEVSEAEGEADIAAGRLANQGRLDVGLAVRSMSQANTALNQSDADKALVDEKSALTFLMRAFSHTRIILPRAHRAGAVGSLAAVDWCPVGGRARRASGGATGGGASTRAAAPRVGRCGDRGGRAAQRGHSGDLGECLLVGATRVAGGTRARTRCSVWPRRSMTQPARSGRGAQTMRGRCWTKRRYRWRLRFGRGC